MFQVYSLDIKTKGKEKQRKNRVKNSINLNYYGFMEDSKVVAKSPLLDIFH